MPAAYGGLHETLTCCRAASAEQEFLVCPECAQRILRCPSCRGAMSAMGHCESCLQLSVVVPQRVRLEEGGGCDLPLQVFSRNATVAIQRMRVQIGQSSSELEVGGAPCESARPWIGQMPLRFDGHGEFGLHLTVELDWAAGQGLAFTARSQSMFLVRPRRDGAWIQGGTGNLVNISGDATSWLTEQHATGAEGSQSLPMHAEFRRAIGRFGDRGRIVSLRSQLLVPDFLGDTACLRLTPAVGSGVTLGRDRPKEPPQPGAQHRAALRFPSQMPDHIDLSRGISREHLRIGVANGHWEVLQLGQRPSILILATDVPAGEAVHELPPGTRRPLMEGDRIQVLGDRGIRFGMELRHKSVLNDHVQESELRLL